MTSRGLNLAAPIRPMYVRMLVTDEERALIQRAAAQAGWSVSMWATVNLVQLAEIETSGAPEMSA